MTIRHATDADIPLILSLLRATPNPPNESEDSIADIIASEPTYIDTEAPAVARIVRRPGEEIADFPWWTWLGGGDIEAKLMPVFKEALTAFIKEHGRASLTWQIGGTLSGFGETKDAKQADADTRADAVKNFLQRGLPINSVLRVRALNGKDAYLQSTVGLMAERAGIDVDAVVD